MLVIWILSNLVHGDSPITIFAPKMNVSFRSNVQQIVLTKWSIPQLLDVPLGFKYKKSIISTHPGFTTSFSQKKQRRNWVSSHACQPVSWYLISPQKTGCWLSSVPESSTTLHRCWPLAVPHKKPWADFDGIYPVAWRKSTWRCSSCLWDHQIELIKKVQKKQSGHL